MISRGFCWLPSPWLMERSWLGPEPCFFALVGGWALPLWKIWKSLGMMKLPIYGNISKMFQTTNQICSLVKGSVTTKPLMANLWWEACWWSAHKETATLFANKSAAELSANSQNQLFGTRHLSQNHRLNWVSPSQRSLVIGFSPQKITWHCSFCEPSIY